MANHHLGKVWNGRDKGESWKWEIYSPAPAGKFSPKSHAHALPHRTLQGKV